MRRKNEQYEKFSDIVDWEVANLIEDENKLDLFYGNFKVKHYAPKFNDYVKKQLFSLIFNYQLLKYLSVRIDQLMKPNKDDVISFFGNQIEIDSKNDLEESEMSSSDSIELKGIDQEEEELEIPKTKNIEKDKKDKEKPIITLKKAKSPNKNNKQKNGDKEADTSLVVSNGQEKKEEKNSKKQSPKLKKINISSNKKGRDSFVRSATIIQSPSPRKSRFVNANNENEKKQNQKDKKSKNQNIEKIRQFQTSNDLLTSEERYIQKQLLARIKNIERLGRKQKLLKLANSLKAQKRNKNNPFQGKFDDIDYTNNNSNFSLIGLLGFKRLREILSTRRLNVVLKKAIELRDMNIFVQINNYWQAELKKQELKRKRKKKKNKGVGGSSSPNRKRQAVFVNSSLFDSETPSTQMKKGGNFSEMVSELPDKQESPVNKKGQSYDVFMNIRKKGGKSFELDFDAINGRLLVLAFFDCLRNKLIPNDLESPTSRSIAFRGTQSKSRVSKFGN